MDVLAELTRQVQGGAELVPADAARAALALADAAVADDTKIAFLAAFAFCASLHAAPAWR